MSTDADLRARTRPVADPRWVVVLATVAVVLTAFNLRPAVTSLGALLPEARAGTGTSAAVAGLLTSLPPVCFGLAAAFGTRLGRRFGTGITLLLSMVVTAALLAARGTSGSSLELVAWSVPALVTMGIGNLLLPVAVKRWFPERVGAATGWYAVALATGTAAAAGLSVPTADLAGSWRVGIGIWAVPALLAAIPWWWLRDGARRRADRRSEAGAAADDALARRVRRDRRAWALGGYFGFQSMAAYSVMGWLPSILREAGLSPSTAGSLLAVVMLTGAPVGLVLPTLAGRRDDQRPLVVVVITIAALAFTGLLVAPAAAPLLWAVMIGIGLGGFPLALALIGLRATTTVGTAALSSLGQGAGYLIAATGPVTIGVLRDVTGSWTVPLLVVIASLVPQLLFGLVAARPGVLDHPA